MIKRITRKISCIEWDELAARPKNDVYNIVTADKYNGKECKCGGKIRYVRNDACVRCAVKKKDTRDYAPDPKLTAIRRKVEKARELEEINREYIFD